MMTSTQVMFAIAVILGIASSMMGFN